MIYQKNLKVNLRVIALTVRYTALLFEAFEKAKMLVHCKDCSKRKTKQCAMDIWTEDATIYKAEDSDYCSRAIVK